MWPRMPKSRNGMETEFSMIIRAILLSFVLYLPLPIFAQGNTDTLVMKNGDRFTCEIKGLSDGVLSVKLSYVDGTISVQWSQVEHLESSRLFLVQTESGAVYTGKLSTASESKDPPIKIQIAEEPNREVEVPRRQIVGLSQTSEGFWRRFNGGINTGLLYSKGNESFQYNLSSELDYERERWTSGASFNSSFTSNSGASISTRNQTDLDTLRLLRWNNWFYAGNASFLQSSVQEITRQTTLGAGIGRFFKKTNRAKIYVLGGFGWQNTVYQQHTADEATQNSAVGFVGTEIKAFKFKKTNVDITATLLPVLSQPGRVRFNTNAAYYIKIAGDLSWNISFYGNWDNKPPAHLAGSDYGSSSGLTWTFGNK
jgi:hypothetical protein